MSTLRQRNKSLYWAWKAMKQRTQNPKCHAYKNYGARGISVCAEWQAFEPFCEWALTNGYQQGLDLDRVDNNGNYCPENCRWITRQENINNRRKTLFFTVDGKRLSCSSLAELSGIPRGSIKVWAETKGFSYAEKRIKDALVNGYVPKDYGNQRKAVRHVESGRVFRTLFFYLSISSFFFILSFGSFLSFSSFFFLSLFSFLVTAGFLRYFLRFFCVLLINFCLSS